MSQKEIHKKIILPDGPLIFTASGAITGKEVLQALRELLNDPECKTSMDILWNFRAVTTRIVDAQEIKDLVNFIRTNQTKRGSDYRVALVVSRDMDYGLVRMYKAYSQDLPFQLRIFEELEEAESWLKPLT